MNKLISVLAFLSLSAMASTDSLVDEPQPELGIAPIEIESPTKAGKELMLDLPDYHEETIVKKIEIDKKHRQKSLKYPEHRNKKNM